MLENLSLTPGRGGHQDHLQQQKDQEELHVGWIFRKNTQFCDLTGNNRKT